MNKVHGNVLLLYLAAAKLPSLTDSTPTVGSFVLFTSGPFTEVYQKYVPKVAKVLLWFHSILRDLEHAENKYASLLHLFRSHNVRRHRHFPAKRQKPPMVETHYT